MAFPSIMLFSDPQQFRSEPSGFLVSILVHGVAAGCLYLGLQHTPKIDNRLLAQQYTVRLITVSRSDPQFHLRVPGRGSEPNTSSVMTIRQPGTSVEGKAIRNRMIRDAMYRVPAPQTLLQPDLPPDMTLREKVPVPSIVMWSPENSSTKRLIPRAAVASATAEAIPSLASPNRELMVADWKMAASKFVTQAPSLPPSSTTPLAVHGPSVLRRVPETTSITAESPTPARILAVSPLQVAQGIVAVPVANQLAGDGPTSAGIGVEKHDMPVAVDNSSANGRGRTATPEAKVAVEGSAIAGRPANGVSGTRSSQREAQGVGEDELSGPGEHRLKPDLSITHIALPQNGKFGVVVVGSTPAEEYPEVQEAWGGRLAYTVYLHVGLAKNWILQYSLPREVEAAAAGAMVRPEAPWPYTIERPNFEELNVDTIIIHGFVNVAGRLEQLSFVFPTDFPKADFMLGALRRWQFRPAMQSGQPIPIEVLLIIPRGVE